MKRQILLLVFLVVISISCNSKIDSTTYSQIIKKGNEISNLSQGTLLSNVGKAIQKNGPEYAVEFCNLKASSIIDSLNLVGNCKISRVSVKNRNPENKLEDKSEMILWELFEKGLKNDTVIRNKKDLIYYKPIRIALPACLKCHGIPESEINTATMDKIQRLYPDDLATGYKMNDLRGLWKIQFNE